MKLRCAFPWFSLYASVWGNLSGIGPKYFRNVFAYDIPMPVDRIEEFKREKHNMVDEIESYKKGLLREQEGRKIELADQERRNVQAKNAMNHEFEEKFKQLEAVAADNARKELNRKTKMIFIENEKMVCAQ